VWNTKGARKSEGESPRGALARPVRLTSRENTLASSHETIQPDVLLHFTCTFFKTRRLSRTPRGNRARARLSRRSLALSDLTQ